MILIAASWHAQGDGRGPGFGGDVDDLLLLRRAILEAFASEDKRKGKRNDKWLVKSQMSTSDWKVNRCSAHLLEKVPVPAPSASLCCPVPVLGRDCDRRLQHRWSSDFEL